MSTLVVAVWFATLGLRHLLPSDEGRYAEIAREMQATGDWVTIRYNGIKYFEKPPLHLWATALAYTVLGVGDAQARLWAGISGMVGIGAVMVAARRWFGRRTSLLAGLVLLAAPAWNLGGHFNSLDIGVSAALACALAAFLVAQHPEATALQRRRWMLGAWLAIALAVLTKGLIGIVLPGLVLTVYAIATRDLQLWRRLELLRGLALFLVVSAPWFVLISWRNPEFPHFFFIHEHLQRYTSSIHRRDAPFWYFVPQLLLGFLPWLGLARAGLARGGAARVGATRASAAALPGDEGVKHAVEEGADKPARAARFRPRLLLALWAGAIFVFFSLSSSKLPGYLLPVYPALAILAALALDRISARSWRRQLVFMLALAALGLLATPWLAGMSQDDTPNDVYRRYALAAAAMFGFALAGLAFAWRWRNRADLLPSIAAASIGWFGAFTIGIVGHEAFGRLSSGVGLVPAIEAVLAQGPGMPIYAVRLLDHTLPFYLRRTTIMVEEPDELGFGTALEPARWLPTLAAFEARWRGGGPALAIMAPDTFERLTQDQLPMRVVARDPRRVVVTNAAPLASFPRADLPR